MPDQPAWKVGAPPGPVRPRLSCGCLADLGWHRDSCPALERAAQRGRLVVRLASAASAHRVPHPTDAALAARYLGQLAGNADADTGLDMATALRAARDGRHGAARQMQLLAAAALHDAGCDKATALAVLASVQGRTRFSLAPALPGVSATPGVPAGASDLAWLRRVTAGDAIPGAQGPTAA